MRNHAEISISSKFERLGAGLFLIFVFIFFAAPLLTDEILKDEFKQIKNAELDCTPLFYTESEEAMRAVYSLEQKLKNE